MQPFITPLPGKCERLHNPCRSTMQLSNFPDWNNYTVYLKSTKIWFAFKRPDQDVPV
ncbi:TPA: hypothetical protein I8Z14_002368 [Legionella pneumophila]|nr:hypothetical protein [Legionella pneumophila]HAT1924333.1 hypothetical protein [Legionella pneumophila]